MSYYSSAKFNPSFEIRIDLSMCKLIGAVGKLSGISSTKGELELARLKKSAQKMRKKSDATKAIIYEYFYKIDIRNMRLHKIAKIIETYLIERGIVQTNGKNGNHKDYTKTIKRYLLADEKIKSDLIALGVIKK